MGKIIAITLCALFLSGWAEAKKPKRAGALPSHVKTIHLQMAKKPIRKKQTAKPVEIGDYAPELQAEAGDNPDASKYLSRSVYYFRSDSPLPEDYNCDEGIEESKKMEAQAQAENKCAERGGEDCRVAKVVIAKTGVLHCDDFPGRKCPSRGHYRGCVAEALVLGEKREAL